MRILLELWLCGLREVCVKEMREVSSVTGMSVDECFQQCDEFLKPLVLSIRAQKKAGKRPRPSAALLGISKTFTSAQRKQLLDKIALLVDENWSGRADMCKQFAYLLSRALKNRGFTEVAVVSGKATYLDKSGKELYTWEHCWVRVNDDLIDGNADALAENPYIPRGLHVKPYWGEFTQLPQDRKLDEHLRGETEADSDVDNIWWPELENWIEQKCSIPKTT